MSERCTAQLGMQNFQNQRADFEVKNVANSKDHVPLPSSKISMSNAPLVIENLKKSFGDTQILKGVTLAAQPGERIALIGSNGSGKSTLLRSTLRLIEPDGGTVTIHGKEIQKLSKSELKKIRSQIGFVFQKHNLVPRLCALTNVIHGIQGKSGGITCWFQSFASKANRLKALDCLSQVGLAHVASQRVGSLSGGQSQRVAIARALMQEPAIIFADEPVASLDPEAGTQVMELLSTLAKEKGITLVFTTHHLEHAIEYSDKIVGLQNGTITFEGDANSFTVEGLREFYN